MVSKVLFVIAAAVAVNAQSNTFTSQATSTSVPTVSACIVACIQGAAAQNGCHFNDLTCVCVSAQFRADTLECLKEHCSATDLANAQSLRDSTCGASGLTATATATARPVSFTLSASAATQSSTKVSKAAAKPVLANGAGAVLGALFAGVLAL